MPLKPIGWTLRIASYLWGGMLLLWYGWKVFLGFALFDLLFVLGRDLCQKRVS